MEPDQTWEPTASGLHCESGVEHSENKVVAPADGGAAALLDPAFTPGTSEFRVKGNAYRGHQDFVDNHLPGGASSQRAALSDLSPALGPVWSDYLEQRFLASRWYDTYPLAVAGIACAKITGEPFLEFVHRRTCIQARNDIGTMHRLLLRLVSTRTIAKRVPLVASQYFDFVTATTHEYNEARVSGELAGVPLDLAPWWAAIANAYVGTAIELARGEPGKIETTSFEPTGEAHGVPICTVHTSVTLQATKSKQQSA